MHVVLIRFSSLGDIVLQTPLVAWLKKINKNIKITFVTSAEFSQLVENHPFIDDVLYHQRKSGTEDIRELYNLSKKLKQKKPDLIIDLHNTTRAKLLRLLSFNIPTLKVYKRSLFRKLLVWFKWDKLKKLKSHHERIITDFNFLFGDDFERADLAAFIQNQTKQEASSLTTIPESFNLSISKTMPAKYVVVSPVASFVPKRWPIESYKKLCEMFLTDDQLSTYHLIILGGPKDDYCQQINVSENKRFNNLQGKTSLKETNEILKHAELVLTNDTGVGHMAEALGVNVLAIFGPTSPSFGFRPHLENSEVITANVKCSPCSETGSKACSQPSLLCMNQIKVENVFEKLKTKLLVEASC